MEKNHTAWVVGRLASPVVHRQVDDAPVVSRQVYDVVVEVDNNSCIQCSREKNHTAWAVCRPALQVVPVYVGEDNNSCS